VITVVTVKSIKARVVDQGFWLQTGYIVKDFSYGEADKGF
jgi:hypothetical protein